jgi:hypothetical protein
MPAGPEYALRTDRSGRRIHIMDRMLPLRRLAVLLMLGLATVAQAQPGGGMPVTLRVVDQNGTELTGSKITLVGSEQGWETPATVNLDFGPALFTIEPAFQGAMFANGWMRPPAPNQLTRDEFLFVDGSPELVVVWNTATVPVNVVDPAQNAIPGASWGFEGDGRWFAPGTVTMPVTDEVLYPSMSGASRDGWRFAVRAAFDGQAIDLNRAEAREVDGSTSGLSFEWRQSACNMGVVDGAGVPIRGATWTMFGHTFAAGDAITLPATDYASAGGSLADGIPASIFTNTTSGSGDATFEVNADGSLSPASVTIGGGSFGLRCGVAPFPPITNGTLDGTVLADGKPKPGVEVTLQSGSSARTLTSDAVGGFVFTEVPQGAVTVSIKVPTGYHALQPKTGSLTANVTAGANTTVQFEIESDTPPPPVVNVPETANYWRKEVRAALRGRGNHNESLADMSANYPQAIFDGFANNPDPVRVQGVTQVDPDGAGPQPARRLTLQDMDATIDPTVATPNAEAKKELLVILLNVVSHRLSLNLVVDAQGTTLAQQIRILAAMINDGKIANVRLHPSMNEVIDSIASSGVPSVETGVVAQREGGRSVRFTMTMAQAGEVTLDLYDVGGRHVERLYQGTAPAGETGINWSGGAVRPGMYFARMIAADGSHGAKVIVQ